jgi:DNA invertase Pin-like site-specific DNA recombinase
MTPVKLPKLPKPASQINKGKFVAYFRVALEGSGNKHIPMGTQRDRVMDYLAGGKWSLIGEFTELEPGRMTERPALASAVKLCKRERATLVVATFDRLTRDMAFFVQLVNDEQVKFVCAEFPEVTRDMLRTRMVFADWEAKKIGERTRAALGELKLQGVKLGSPRPEIGSAAAVVVIKAKAEAYAAEVGPVVREIIRKSGAKTLRELAEVFMERGILTPRGGTDWYASGVRNLLARIEKN